MYYAVSFLTVFVNIILSTTWCFFEKTGLKYTFKFDDFQNLLNLIITPLILIVLNVCYIRNNAVKWYMYIPLILTVIVLNSVISYMGWGIRTDKLLAPDAETVMVTIYVNTIFPLITTILGIGLYNIVKH